MQGIIIALLLGWAGGYRFYKKQYGLGCTLHRRTKCD